MFRKLTELSKPSNPLIVLALDTTGGHCTAALLQGDQLAAQKCENIGRGHAERLAPMVQDIMIDSGISAKNIDRVAVCTGPGSFTGLRVGLAFAKGFALPRALPVIGISVPDVLARQADPDQSQKIISVINARRGDVCWGLYDRGQCLISPRTDPVDVAQTQIMGINADQIIGDGAGLVSTASDITVVSGESLARIAATLSPEEYPPTPLYARGPDAKLPGGITL